MNFSLVILFLCIVFVNSFVHINRIESVSLSRSFKISSTSDRELLIEACKTRNVDRVALLSVINQILSKKGSNILISDNSIEGTKWECIFCNVAGGAANGFVLGGILFQLT
jgi:hypothetical protein